MIKYDEKVKNEVVAKFLFSKLSARVVGEEYGISSSCVYKWVKEYSPAFVASKTPKKTRKRRKK